jgi:hypothetical protein
MKKSIQIGFLLGVLPLAIASLHAGTEAAQGSAAASDKLAATNSNALIDALVKKGVLTNDEAKGIEADLQKQAQSTPGGFLQLGSSADKGLRIYGDARLRFQWNTAATAGPGNENHDQDRYRIRVRLGADYRFAENWKAGVRLETGSKSDSANTDFGGFFSKDNSALSIGLAYLEYENNSPSLFNNSIGDYVDFRAGKILQPYFSNDLLWYSEVNPEGFAEQIGWKDVGAEGLDLTLRGGEFIISNVNEDSSWVTGQTPSSDQFLFIAQAEAKYKFDKNVTLTVAPSYITETHGSAYVTANQQDGGAAFDTGQLPQVNGYTYFGRIDVVTLPVEVNWKAFGLPNRVYGTWGYNLSANDRAKVYGLADGAGNQFFNVGYQLGDTKKKGHWQVGAEYRFVEAASYDSFLTDSNFASNYLNQQGFILRASYAFTDNIWGAVSYFHSNSIDGNATPVRGLTASSNTASSLIKQVDLFQLDLNWKF